MYDQKNVCDSAALGTGAGYGTFPLTTETQWQAMLGDSPVSMFSWLVNSGINTVALAKARYLWTPRTFKWEITNQETFPMQMKVYWVKPRRDLDRNTNDYSNLELMSMSGTDLNDFTARCFDRDGILTWGANVLKNALPISFTPFQSHTWCQFFKVVKVQKVKVDAGQCVVINRKANRWVSVNDIDIGDIEYIAQRRQVIPFIHMVGCPVYDSTDLKKVGTGKCRISMVYTARHSFYTMNLTVQQYKKVDLGPPAGGLTSANARYVSKPVAAAVAQV